MLPDFPTPSSSQWPEVLFWPDPLQQEFAGFEPAAFDLLDALRRNPYVETYQALKPELDRNVQTPFKVFRDDLAVNWVLPNGLELETERNVFSRLLKNDFGAGGSHHHIWLAFYRKERTRLKDVQLAFAIRPEGVSVSLFVGGRANALVDRIRTALKNEPASALDLINGVLEHGGWQFSWSKGSGGRKKGGMASTPLVALPDNLDRMDTLWLRTLVTKEDVLDLEGVLLQRALEHVETLWPLYRWWLQVTGSVPV